MGATSWRLTHYDVPMPMEVAFDATSQALLSEVGDTASAAGTLE